MTTLFSKPSAPGPAPVPTAPPVMPDTMSPDVLAAKRKAIADAGAGGRASTNLTTAGANAGATLAGSTKLGG